MDKLTKFVCVDCEMTLLHFTEFCEMIKKTQQHLKASIASTKERKSVPNKNDKTLVSFYTTIQNIFAKYRLSGKYKDCIGLYYSVNLVTSNESKLLILTTRESLLREI